MTLTICEFDAHFTSGLMKGLVIKQDMKFSGETEAFDWAVRVNENERIGECPFWVSDIKKIGEVEL